jgi:hypothetical protein
VTPPLLALVEVGGEASAAPERSTCGPLKVQSVALPPVVVVVVVVKGPADSLAVDATEISSTPETIS